MSMTKSVCQTVSTADRDAVVLLIEQYMNDEIGAFRFDEQLQSIRSNDPVVNRAIRELWYMYDDLKDHKIVASKQEWDFLQRVLLLLKSDVEAWPAVPIRRVFTPRQLVAILCLAAFAYSVIRLGFAAAYGTVGLGIGLISILLSRRYYHDHAAVLPTMSAAIYPFASFAELRRAYRRWARSRKRAYPAHLKQRQIRSGTEASIIRLHSYYAQLVLGPVALLFQAMPEKWPARTAEA